MSAQELREAAALMRERAEGSLAGPWQWVTDEDSGEQYIVAANSRDVAQVNEWSSGLWGGPHIASWHPAVALKVAAALDSAAAILDESHDGPLDMAMRAIAEPLVDLARTYLGDDQ